LEQLTEPFFCASLNQPGIRISDNSFRITEFEIKVPGLSFHVLKFQNLNLCQIQNFDYIEGSKKYGFFGHSYFQFRFIFCALDTQAFAYPSSSLNGSNMMACHLRLRFIFCALDTQALACPSSSLNGSNMAACHLRLRFIFCALDTQALTCPSSSLNGSNMAALN
jgi:hypothetical protein